MLSAMFLAHVYLPVFLFVVFASANVPPVPGHAAYYNTTELSATTHGPTQVPSGTAPGTIVRRGLTSAPAISASASSPPFTNSTKSVPTSPTGKPPVSSGSVKPTYFSTSSGTHTASAGTPTYASSSIKRTVLSNGLPHSKRTIPNANSTLTSTVNSTTSVIRTRLSTGYTYSRPSALSSGPMSTSATIPLPKPTTTGSPSLSSGLTSTRPPYSPTTFRNATLTTSTLHQTTGFSSTTLTFPTSNTTTTPTPSPSSTFTLQVFVTANDATSPPISGAFISIHPTPSGGDALLLSDIASASLFTLNADRTLQSGNDIAAMPAAGSFGRLMLQREAEIGSDFEKTVCENVGGVLSCETEGDVAFFTCGGVGEGFVEVWPRGAPVGEGCAEFLLLVVWGR